MSTYHSARGRSTYRGRGTSSFGAPRVLPGDRDIMQALSQTSLQTIARILPRENDPEVKITDVEYIGSYNWTNHNTPTIIVPGMCNFLTVQ